MPGCALCGAAELMQHFAFATVSDNWAVLRCQNCGFAFRVLRPCDNAPALRVAPGCQPRYADNNFLTRPREILTSQVVSLDSAAEITELANFKSPPGTLLNVGRNWEIVSRAARLSGWQPFSASAERTLPTAMATSAATPLIHLATLAAYSAAAEDPETLHSALDFDPRPEYDVVRLDGKLEWASDLQECLEWTNARLTAKGILIVVCANFEAWSLALGSDGVALAAAPPARWFFTRKTLRRLLMDAGFRVLKLEVSADQRLLAFARRSERHRLSTLELAHREPLLEPLAELRGIHA